MIIEENKYLYTVSEYAELIGKTTQAVYKQVNKKQIKFINKVVNQKEQVFIICSEPLQKETDNQPTNQKEQEFTNQLPTENNQFLEYLIAENKRLTEQNTELENKIVSLAEELSQIAKTSQQITSQAQVLHLAERTSATEEPNQEPQETEKKSFFKRLFRL